MLRCFMSRRTTLWELHVVRDAPGDPQYYECVLSFYEGLLGGGDADSIDIFDGDSGDLNSRWPVNLFDDGNWVEVRM